MRATQALLYTPTVLRSARIQALLIVAVVCAVLAPSLGSGFVWDDARTVLNRPVMSDPANVPGFFISNIKSGLAETDGITEGFDLYRPMFLTALVGGWAVFGGPWAPGFHALCLLFHLAATLMVFVLARRWLPSGRDGPGPASAALVFGLHPVTSEAYLFVAALAEPMAAFGLLLAVWILDVIAEREADGDASKTPLLLGASFAAMLFGLFSKESPLLLLPVMSLWLVARGLRPSRLVPAWIAAGIFLVMRASAVGGLGAAGNDSGQRIEALRRLPLLLMDGLRASVTLTPRGLRHLGYEWATVSTGVVAACAVGVVAVTAGAVLLRRRAPLVTLFVFALGSCLLPVAMVTTVPDWGGFGRYLYAPWAVGAMALVGGLSAGLSRLDEARPGIARRTGVFIVVLYGGLVILGARESVQDWSSPEALAESGIRHAPEVGVHWAWLADARQEEGRLQEAEQLYLEAVARTPEYDPAWIHLAAAQLGMGRCAPALETVARKEQVNAPGPRSNLIKALCLVELGRYDEADVVIEDTLAKVPTHPDFKRLQGELAAIRAAR